MADGRVMPLLLVHAALIVGAKPWDVSFSSALDRAWCDSNASYHHLRYGHSARVQWRDVLPYILALPEYRARFPSTEGDIYEFGVASGASMLALNRFFPTGHMFGFDSFMGTPEDDGAPTPLWSPGAFSYDVRRPLGEALKGRVSFVEGFYNVSLADPHLTLNLNMRPAQFVDVDCDLYISTYQALDFMFAHNLIRPGTLIGYDDWWVYPCGSNTFRKKRLGGGIGAMFEEGQPLAHKQLVEKYGVHLECVAGSCASPPSGYFTTGSCSAFNTGGPIFLVLKVGKHGEARGGERHEGHAGFRMTEPDYESYTAANRRSANARNLFCPKACLTTGKGRPTNCGWDAGK